MKIVGTIFVIAAGACLLVSAASAQGQQTRDEQMKAYVDLLSKDLRVEKQAIVDRAMGLEAGDKAKFWTVYEKYQGEVQGLWDQRLLNMKKFADNYPTMTDTVADEIVMKAMDIDSQRAAMRRKYYSQMKTALGARVAARFLQVEVMLDQLVGLQIGSAIPLIQ